MFDIKQELKLFPQPFINPFFTLLYRILHPHIPTFHRDFLLFIFYFLIFLQFFHLIFMVLVLVLFSPLIFLKLFPPWQLTFISQIMLVVISTLILVIKGQQPLLFLIIQAILQQQAIFQTIMVFLLFYLLFTPKMHLHNFPHYFFPYLILYQTFYLILLFLPFILLNSFPKLCFIEELPKSIKLFSLLLFIHVKICWDFIFLLEHFIFSIQSTSYFNRVSKFTSFLLLPSQFTFQLIFILIFMTLCSYLHLNFIFQLTHYCSKQFYFHLSSLLTSLISFLEALPLSLSEKSVLSSQLNMRLSPHEFFQHIKVYVFDSFHN